MTSQKAKNSELFHPMELLDDVFKRNKRKLFVQYNYAPNMQSVSLYVLKSMCRDFPVRNIKSWIKQ